MIYSANKSSKSIGRKRKSTETSELLPTPEALNQEGYQVANGKKYPRLGAYISSQAVSPASPSPTPDEERERQTTATSGRRCLGLFESSSPDGSLVKMLRDSLLGATVWYSSRCALTWKRKDTRFNRLLFQLAPSMRHIEEIGSGLLAATPTASLTSARKEGEWTGQYFKRGNGKKAQTRLVDQISILPTPRAKDYEGGVEKTENGQVLRKNGVRHGAKVKDVLGTVTGLKLQPAFALWMMGFPPDWCDLVAGEMPPSKRQATRSSHKSQQKSLKQSN